DCRTRRCRPCRACTPGTTNRDGVTQFPRPPKRGEGIYALYASRRPGCGQSTERSLPVPDAVIKAVFIAFPPQQMLVTSGSAIAVCRTFFVPGQIVVVMPTRRVAT